MASVERLHLSEGTHSHVALFSYWCSSLYLNREDACKFGKVPHICCYVSTLFVIFCFDLHAGSKNLGRVSFICRYDFILCVPSCLSSEVKGTISHRVSVICVYKIYSFSSDSEHWQDKIGCAGLWVVVISIGCGTKRNDCGVVIES